MDRPQDEALFILHKVLSYIPDRKGRGPRLIPFIEIKDMFSTSKNALSSAHSEDQLRAYTAPELLTGRKYS